MEMWNKLEKRLYIVSNAPNEIVVNVCTLKNRIFIPAIWSYNRKILNKNSQSNFKEKNKTNSALFTQNL